MWSALSGSWVAAIVIYVFVEFVFQKWYKKKLADLGSQKKSIFLLYASAFAASLAFAMFASPVALNWAFVAIFCVGFLNGFANYCSWRAAAVSLSKDSLFTFMDDVIAIALAYWFLGETRHLNFGVVGGTIVSVGAAVFLTALAWKRGGIKDELAFLRWVGIYSVLWGIAVFTMKYVVVNGAENGTCLVAWYGGAFLAGCILLVTVREKTHGKSLLGLGWMDVVLRSGFGLVIMLSRILQYWVFRTSPMAVAQPICLVSELVLTTLIGLYVFKEAKKYDAKEKVAFAVAFVGGLLVALGFALSSS